MAMINSSVRKSVRSTLAGLSDPVTLLVFTRHRDSDPPTCEACNDTEQLVREMASISEGKVHAGVYDIDDDAEAARQYGIDKVPAIVVLGNEGRKDLGIRFFGIPSGYEFGTLLEDIRMVSQGQAGLTRTTVEALTQLQTPLHIQVFVTPTCPYCPRAVLLAHRMALAGDMVTADMIDATEFPELAERYDVYGVPRTVVNETFSVEGAVPEAMLIAELAPLFRAKSTDAPPAGVN